MLKFLLFFFFHLFFHNQLRFVPGWVNNRKSVNVIGNIHKKPTHRVTDMLPSLGPFLIEPGTPRGPLWSPGAQPLFWKAPKDGYLRATALQGRESPLPLGPFLSGLRTLYKTSLAVKPPSPSLLMWGLPKAQVSSLNISEWLWCVDLREGDWKSRR